MKKTPAIFLAVISAIGIQSCNTPEESFRERHEYDSTAYYNVYPYNTDYSFYLRRYYYPYYYPNYNYPYGYYHHYSDRGGFGYYGSHHSVWS